MRTFKGRTAVLAKKKGSNRVQSLLFHYEKTRKLTLYLTEPLQVEDCVVQSMPDASPTKWHLAHTSWFFETFLLKPYDVAYKPFHIQFNYLFNSYYNGVGKQFPRPQRGLLSRPTLNEIFEYRDYVDRAMLRFMRKKSSSQLSRYESTLVLGLHHEQQHQELILTDIKSVLASNPLKPVYRNLKKRPCRVGPMKWVSYKGGLQWIGYSGKGFSFDNETPLHRQWLNPFLLSSRLVTNGEYLKFMEDGGYERPEFWLSEGWKTVCQQKWKAPAYWEKQNNKWWIYKLSGFEPIHMNEPVCHVSYYEADAFARWAGVRLPTEFEWEVAAKELSLEGNFVEQEMFHPIPLSEKKSGKINQMFGDVWEWTQSAYSPYSGYKPLRGPVGEYNGKFMSGQMVLRGGSCGTSQSHIRSTYRNFFYPPDRWQFSGIRLARDPQ